MGSIIECIRAELRANVDKKTQATERDFFREEIIFYGVKTPIVNKIALSYWREVEKLGKRDVFGLCEELFRSGYMEEAFVVSVWLPRFIDRLEPNDICTFKMWINRYVDNWAKCDSFCNHTVGDLIEKYPQVSTEVKGWANSKCRWLRRASAVSFILPVRKGDFLKEAFEISDALLVDSDDLVQKGYGWLLKEASRKHQIEVFDYVVRNRKVMPRTALRYAIELLPKTLRAEAMKQD